MVDAVLAMDEEAVSTESFQLSAFRRLYFEGDELKLA